jgi:hypothetical protein
MCLHETCAQEVVTQGGAHTLWAAAVDMLRGGFPALLADALGVFVNLFTHDSIRKQVLQAPPASTVGAGRAGVGVSMAGWWQ